MKTYPLNTLISVNYAAFGLVIVFLCFDINSTFAQPVNFNSSYKLQNEISSPSEEVSLFVSHNNELMSFNRRALKDENEDVFFVYKKQKDGNWVSDILFPFPKHIHKHKLELVGFTFDQKSYYLEKLSKNKNIVYFKKGESKEKQHLHKIDKKSKKIINLYVHPSDSIMVLSLSIKSDTNSPNTDIYICLKDKKGSWSNPFSAGLSVNSQYKEITPFLSLDKNRLYFSSNKPNGKGGFDIYYSDRLHDSWIIWTIPKLLDSSINSNKNETHFFLNKGSAYYISNKEGEKNIYKAVETIYDPFIHIIDDM